MSGPPQGTRPGSEHFDWSWTRDESDWVPPAIDPTTVSAARIYDYLLDGKDSFDVDRAAAERLLTVAPYARELARANREFLRRAVRSMVRDHGIRQLIDFGTGIPTSPSVHELARAEAPDVRVLYLDNDPVVTAHNRAVLATDPGTVTLLRDLREPDTVLEDPRIRAWLDVQQPVGLLFVAVLHFVSIDLAPALLARYRDAVAPGSCLAVSAACRDLSDPVALQVAEGMFDGSGTRLYARSTAQVEQLFEGFRLTEPLAPVAAWGLAPGEPRIPVDVPATVLAGMGIKE